MVCHSRAHDMPRGAGTGGLGEEKIEVREWRMLPKGGISRMAEGRECSALS